MATVPLDGIVGRMMPGKKNEMQPTYYVKHPDDSYSEANPQPLLDPEGNFEAKRLRRLALLLGISVPESDEALLSACGTVLGMAAQVIEDTFRTHPRKELGLLRAALDNMPIVTPNVEVQGRAAGFSAERPLQRPVGPHAEE